MASVPLTSSLPSSPASSTEICPQLPEDLQWKPYLQLPGSPRHIFLSEISDTLVDDLTSRTVLKYGIGNAIVVERDVSADLAASLASALQQLQFRTYHCIGGEYDENFDDIDHCSVIVNHEQNILILAPRDTATFLAACLWISKDRSSRSFHEALERMKEADVQLTTPYENSLQKFYDHLQKKAPLGQPKAPPLPPKPSQRPLTAPSEEDPLKGPTPLTALLAEDSTEKTVGIFEKFCCCLHWCCPSKFTARGDPTYTRVGVTSSTEL